MTMSVLIRSLVVSLALLTLAGCSAKKSTSESALPVAEVTEPGENVAVAPEAAAEGDERPKETCHGALDCTFFGLGAVLAAPFWVLGAFLGVVF